MHWAVHLLVGSVIAEAINLKFGLTGAILQLSSLTTMKNGGNSKKIMTCLKKKLTSTVLV